jgi:YggT family protein
MIWTIVNGLGMFYTLLIFIWALFSWFDHSSGIMRDVYQVLDSVCRPYVSIFRKFIPTPGGVDFSPFVALLVIQIVLRILSTVLI